ncbi:endonuclease III [Pelagibius litoralis]|uniref:Endonuclease III n=1 Tax=Pelagibius litoralis TaxID=374515 RepID=A0A967EYJ2_9PROT|nr:endonuclease III [Pelagibius litoralis]NIA69790.1 endonuclease III [Pelagibius litoralis]
MQLALDIDGRHRVLEEIHRRLRLRFGRPGPWRLLDPMSQLVLGLVGGRTYGAVSLGAFEALADRFASWEQVRDAPEASLYETIAAVTFADVKAGRIKASLRMITEARGALTLDFLQYWRVDQALAWLERLPGVGRKTAAATLNLSTLRMKALVIDTHHLRVLRRLGLAGRRADAREAYDRILPYLPAAWGAEDMDVHHQLMKVLGQQICSHGLPCCGNCPLNSICEATTQSR